MAAPRSDAWVCRGVVAFERQALDYIRFVSQPFMHKAVKFTRTKSRKKRKRP